MTRQIYSRTSRALSAVFVAGLLALPQSLEAQRATRRGGDGGGQTSAGAPSGGGEQSPSAQAPGGGNTTPRGGGDRAPRGGGAERRAARPREPSRPAATSTPRADSAATAPADADALADSGGGASSLRRRGDSPRTGTAVARRVRRPGNRGTIIVPGGWYPWGWGGYGFAGYYGFYDPWWYGGYGYPARYSSRRDDGAVRLKVKPRAASVYVDGYYAGKVDDFDGVFQSLPLEPGPHRIEVQLEGYTPLTFDVRVLPERTVTLESEMTPVTQ